MSDQPFVRFDWIWDNSDKILERLVEHLELTIIAVVLGFLIAFPISLYSYRHRRAYAPITWVAGVLYTIPSVALFAFLVPFTGLSTTTAEIGLVSYTLLIFIRNIVGGLDAVPEDARDAARGMGYTPRQVLWKVELPLAIPVIFAGIRIATVTTIGLVTVTALIGKGGFGYFILQGLSRFFNTATILGAVLSIALAVVADRLLISAERRLTPWSGSAGRTI